MARGTLQQLGIDLESKEGMLQSQRKELAQFGTAATIGEIGALAIDYSMLKTDNLFKENQAKEIEIQAQEQANMLRENFNVALGQEAVQVARRGITQSSGSVRAGKELSSKNIGEDIKGMKKTASKRAGKIRAEAGLAKRAGKAKVMSGLLSGVSSLSTNINALRG